MMVAFFLLLAIAGAIGATIEASLGASPALVGGLTAIAFIGLAGAAARGAVDLRAPDTLSEPREARGPTPPAKAPPDTVSRGVFGNLWFAAIGAFGVLGLVPLVSLARKPGRTVRTGWSPGTRLVTADNRPVRADHLATDGIETVFPENGVNVPDSAAVLIRVEPSLLAMPPGRAGWTPAGYVAYSKICTHAGCPVALYRSASHELYCPCHQSLFNVLDGATNVGGPAPRPLPQLGLAVNAAGYLIARADFAEPVGPDDWNRTIS